MYSKRLSKHMHHIVLENEKTIWPPSVFALAMALDRQQKETTKDENFEQTTAVLVDHIIIIEQKIKFPPHFLARRLIRRRVMTTSVGVRLCFVSKGGRVEGTLDFNKGEDLFLWKIKFFKATVLRFKFTI